MSSSLPSTTESVKLLYVLRRPLSPKVEVDAAAATPIQPTWMDIIADKDKLIIDLKKENGELTAVIH